MAAAFKLHVFHFNFFLTIFSFVELRKGGGKNAGMRDGNVIHYSFREIHEVVLSYLERFLKLVLIICKL